MIKRAKDFQYTSISISISEMLALARWNAQIPNGRKKVGAMAPFLELGSWNEEAL
jgi:hypothetical protein